MTLKNTRMKGQVNISRKYHKTHSLPPPTSPPRATGENRHHRCMKSQLHVHPAGERASQGRPTVLCQTGAISPQSCSWQFPQL